MIVNSSFKSVPNAKQKVVINFEVTVPSNREIKSGQLPPSKYTMLHIELESELIRTGK